ncbi:hypothetical protein CEK69_10965 [Xanthomonas sp. LMG 12462]|uniref:ATP-binding response regulator n=1 Tax=Xanthomonas sp. LMG 12462 TaxID=1591134 RepID=UPI001264E63E|nr:ATP-binding protein [Xanthomonas sp. LMG 12462]KAB7770400.1 hypothetical protein CEK69_10965 [Xanthomonas sp. LMG 12462]
MQDEAQDSSLTLVEVADKLRHKEIDAIVSGYRERSVSLKRTVLVFAVIVWALYWSRGAITDPPDGWQHLSLDQVLPIEATKLLPWLIGLLPACAIWMVLLRSGKIRETEFVDGAGAIANYIIIGMMLSLAWNLTMASATVLPIICIIIGARFGRRYFYLSMLLACVIVAIAAPEHYWVKRPAFAVFAFGFLVGIPLMTNKLLSTLWVISAQAVRSRDAQNRFIATMSHELRTPLNTVINATALIDRSQLPEQQRELVASAEVNAWALLGRVNDVLDVAAIDRGQMAFDNGPFRFSEVLQTVQGVCGPQAVAKAIDFEITGATDLHEIFVGDPARVEQVISNLVSNAIKFTPAGGTVTLRIIDSGPDMGGHQRLSIQVIDSGPGIPDADKSRIFDPFYKGGGSVVRAQSGVGLGLYIVKAVAEQMGSQVEVSDNPGGGSVFTWNIALARAAPGQQVDARIPLHEALERHRASIPAMNFLVFEDNLPNRQVIQWLMSLAGHSVRFAVPGADPIEALSADRPDAILLDLHMPERSGWDVLAEIEAQMGIHQAPPIVIISADSDPNTVTTCLQKGAVAYLTKPIAPHKLLSSVQAISHMARHRTRASGAHEENA